MAAGIHTNPRDRPLERRDLVMQADRPSHPFAVCRKELPNPEPSTGTDYGFVEACSFVRGMANRVPADIQQIGLAPVSDRDGRPPPDVNSAPHTKVGVADFRLPKPDAADGFP